MSKIIGIYRNGNYFVEMYEDGTKVRISKDNKFIPEFAECIDMTITKKCDGGCKYCYMGCTPEGKHCSVTVFEDIIDTLRPYTEVAINVNDMTHPKLGYMLRICKEHRLIANITINQKHFMKNLEKLHNWQKQGLFYGIGISYTHEELGLIDAVQSFKNPVVHLIAGVVTKEDIFYLSKNRLNILILGYKNIKRGEDYKKEFREKIKENTKFLSDNMRDLFRYFNIVSFDNAALIQLETIPKFPQKYWKEHFMGEEGEFTFYIDVVDRTFALNSVTTEIIPFGDYPYNTTEMFQYIRTKFYEVHKDGI